MKCHFCDSKYTWSNTNNDSDIILLTAEDMINYCSNIKYEYEGCTDIVITGGEPLFQENHTDLEIMCNCFKDKNITFETTMLFDFDNFLVSNWLQNMGIIRNKCKLYNNNSYIFSISPKFDIKSYDNINSQYNSLDIENIFKFYSLREKINKNIGDYFYFKIVFEYKMKEKIEYFLDNYVYHENREYIYLMPETIIPFNKDSGQDILNRECAEFCKKKKVNYSPRLHVDLWGLKRGV